MSILATLIIIFKLSLFRQNLHPKKHFIIWINNNYSLDFSCGISVTTWTLFRIDVLKNLFDNRCLQGVPDKFDTFLFLSCFKTKRNILIL